MTQSADTTLREDIEQIEKSSRASRIAVALYDLETNLEFSYRADEWFHAASTIKIPILVGVFGAVDRGEFVLHSRLHVRNRFRSVVDGTPYRLRSSRDANSDVHDAIGKMMQIQELAHHMIATSSNLATNLLVDLVGIENLQATMRQLGVNDGIELRRGVEDEKAFDADINNRVTANGLLKLLHLIADEKAFSPHLSRRMLDILHSQEFKSGIPARLPEGTRVAHKTGEISTVAHDAGVVYLKERKPYVIVVLTEWDPDTGGRSETIARISELVHDRIEAEGD
jgi:beta-lactamase class A